MTKKKTLKDTFVRADLQSVRVIIFTFGNLYARFTKPRGQEFSICFVCVLQKFKTCIGLQSLRNMDSHILCLMIF